MDFLSDDEGEPNENKPKAPATGPLFPTRSPQSLPIAMKNSIAPQQPPHVVHNYAQPAVNHRPIQPQISQAMPQQGHNQMYQNRPLYARPIKANLSREDLYKKAISQILKRLETFRDEQKNFGVQALKDLLKQSKKHLDDQKWQRILKFMSEEQLLKYHKYPTPKAKRVHLSVLIYTMGEDIYLKSLAESQYQSKKLLKNTFEKLKEYGSREDTQRCSLALRTFRTTNKNVTDLVHYMLRYIQKINILLFNKIIHSMKSSSSAALPTSQTQNQPATQNTQIQQPRPIFHRSIPQQSQLQRQNSSAAPNSYATLKPSLSMSRTAKPPLGEKRRNLHSRYHYRAVSDFFGLPFETFEDIKTIKRVEYLDENILTNSEASEEPRKHNLRQSKRRRNSLNATKYQAAKKYPILPLDFLQGLILNVVENFNARKQQEQTELASFSVFSDNDNNSEDMEVEVEVETKTKRKTATKNSNEQHKAIEKIDDKIKVDDILKVSLGIDKYFQILLKFSITNFINELNLNKNNVTKILKHNGLIVNNFTKRKYNNLVYRETFKNNYFHHLQNYLFLKEAKHEEKNQILLKKNDLPDMFSKQRLKLKKDILKLERKEGTAVFENQVKVNLKETINDYLVLYKDSNRNIGEISRANETRTDRGRSEYNVISIEDLAMLFDNRFQSNGLRTVKDMWNTALTSTVD